MPEMIDILRQQAEFTRHSGVTVEADERFPTVCIRDAAGASVFLQSHEAEEFVAKARRAWEEVQDLDWDEVLESAAYPYLDMLAEGV